MVWEKKKKAWLELAWSIAARPASAAAAAAAAAAAEAGSSRGLETAAS